MSCQDPERQGPSRLCKSGKVNFRKQLEGTTDLRPSAFCAVVEHSNNVIGLHRSSARKLSHKFNTIIVSDTALGELLLRQGESAINSI